MTPKKKVDPLAHLKKPTKVKHPEQSRDQKILERKNKGREISKSKMKAK